MSPEIPKPTALATAIANRADVSVEKVNDVLGLNEISLIPATVARRSLTVSRLAFTGRKTNTKWDGPINAEFSFDVGVTALITDENLRGKSSVLEIITWVLRGTPRGLRSDVRPWLDTVTLEYSVNGEHMAVRMFKAEADEMRVDVLTADDQQTLRDSLDSQSTSSASASGAVRTVQQGLTLEEFAQFQENFMLEQLRLDPISNWQKYQGSEDGRPQINGWPAYFGAVYLPDASSKALLGETVYAGLPARLLQMFCNVPLMSSFIKTNTLSAQAKQDDRDHSRRADKDMKSRAHERADLIAQLTTVQNQITQLGAPASRTASVVAAELSAAETDLVTATRNARAAALTLVGATAARQAEAKRVNDAHETALALTLFHGLTPKHCPRCEHIIDKTRIQQETNEHVCAVCTSAIELAEPEADDIDPRDADDAGTDTLQALTEAEQAARESAKEANTEATNAESTFDRLSNELATISASHSFTRRRELELEAARLSGRIEGIPVEGVVIDDQSLTTRVLQATAAVLRDVTRGSAAQIFTDLDQEIAALGRKFGIDNLDEVHLDRRGALKVTTAGVDEAFSKLTGGERLRLRVAVVVALLRIGHRAGVGSHPGLILLDSPGSDELTVTDESALLRELDSLKEEIPGLQVIIASAEPDAVVGSIDESHIYAATGDAPLW